ncbi:MAG: hypothetical protein AB2A00_34200 [Myxococcota bacterium]
MEDRVLRRVRRLLYSAALSGLVLGLSASAATAQQRKKIVLGEITVEGRRQKPQAFYILQRQNLNFEGLELKKSFVPKIEKSVEKQPF